MKYLILLILLSLTQFEAFRGFRIVKKESLTKPYIYLQYTGDTDSYIFPILITCSDKKTKLDIIKSERERSSPEITLNVAINNTSFKEIHKSIPQKQPSLPNNNRLEVFLVSNNKTIKTEISLAQTISLIKLIRNKFPKDDEDYLFLTERIKSYQSLQIYYQTQQRSLPAQNNGKLNSIKPRWR